MGRFAWLLIALLSFLPGESVAASAEHGLTFDASTSRLGDHLIRYLHTKWVSYQTGLPLYFPPFTYSHYFRCHHKERRLNKRARAQFARFIELHDESSLNLEARKATLYGVPWFPESKAEYVGRPDRFRMQVDWEDPQFKKMIRKALSPAKPLELITPPSGRISVALHVRTGGDFKFDLTKGKERYPAKFPPYEYYVEQLKRLDEQLKHAPLYVFVFTDDSDPKGLALFFSRALNRNHIVFDYRKGEELGHDKNVVEDFFSLLNFECLIRPDSNFSIVAEKIGHFSICLAP